MARRRVMLAAGHPNMKLDRIVYTSAPTGNPIASSNIGEIDFLCQNCGDVVINGEFPPIDIEIPDAKVWAVCAKCGSHLFVPPEFIPGQAR